MLLLCFLCCLPAESCVVVDPPSEWLPTNGSWICDGNNCTVVCEEPFELDGQLTTICDTGMKTVATDDSILRGHAMFCWECPKPCLLLHDCGI
jgi:hypothetical protein